MFQDLLNLGATEEQIIKTPETEVTKSVCEECLNILSYNYGNQYFQSGLLTALRFMAEVLVKEEYECLWKKISQRLSSKEGDNSKKRSEFYWFHIIHDDRKSGIGEEDILGGRSHSQEIGYHIARSVSSEEEIEYCIFMEKKVFDIKYKFLNQFVK